jgi:hypothetical protein
MNHCFQRLAAPVCNRQGVAFPIALLGILGVSVTVTAVLLTATTENALSFAHKDATRDLYVSQGAVEAYVAEKGMQLTAIENFSYLRVGDPETNRTRITVRQIGSARPSAPNAQDNWPRDLLFAVEAQPFNSGRTIGALARVMSGALPPILNNVKSAVTSGSNVTVGGNTTLSDGEDSQLCDPAKKAENAIKVGDDDNITWNGVSKSKMVGTEGNMSGPVTSYVEQLLGVKMTDLIANAKIKFAPGEFTGNTTVSSFKTGNTLNVANLLDPKQTPFNWGCPEDLMALSNTPCEADTDTEHAPIVAIDAKNGNNWGTVTVNLDHGQGIIVVYNGHLNIQGNLVYKGLILVEGGFKITGTGNSGVRIEGAVIGLGIGAGGAENEVDQMIGGSPTIRYNACAIDAVLNGINAQFPFQRQISRTSSWYEAVR